MTFDEIVGRFHAPVRVPDGVKVRCSAHDDGTQSLHLTRGDGCTLAYCHAGCSTESVLAAVGLAMADLFEDHGGPREPFQDVPQFGGVPQVKPRLAKVYPYHDEAGALLYEVCRYDPKTFRQRRPDGSGGHLWKLDDVRRVLYRLPELTRSRKTVIVCEGEKNVDALRGIKCTATCNVGGAGKWRPEYNAFLQDRDVVILPDNDQPGREHADKVARMLTGIARSVKVVELPGLPPKGDVHDWIEAGGTKKQLVELLTAATEFDLTALPITSPIASAPTTADVVRTAALYDVGLEDLLVGWMLTATPTERGQWFGRIIVDLVADAQRRMLVEAVLATHGETAAVDAVAVIARVKSQCATVEQAVQFTVAALERLSERAREANVQPSTLLSALDEWRLQRSVKRVQGIALAGDGRASVERMRVALAGEVELSPVEPALDYADVIVERQKVYFGGDATRPRVVTVGLEPFDEQMGGFLPGLVFFAARPAVGKTAIAFRMARGVVETMGRPALFVSLEMKAGSIHDRVIADLAGIENWRVRRAKWVDDAEAMRVAKANALAFELYAGRLFIVEDAASTFDILLAGMHRHMQAHPDTAAVFFDYIQLAHGGAKAETREQEIAGMSRTLKKFADHYGVVMVVLSQLNRSSETEERGRKQKEGRPRMRHMKGSGSQEQDADDVILLHVREEASSTDQDARADEVTLVAYHDKVRNGPTATYYLTFNRPFQRVTDQGRRWSETL